MKNKLHISISNKPKINSMFSCKSITMRELFLQKLFGHKQKVTILIPGDSIEELSVTKIKEGGKE